MESTALFLFAATSGASPGAYWNWKVRELLSFIISNIKNQRTPWGRHGVFSKEQLKENWAYQPFRFLMKQTSAGFQTNRWLVVEIVARCS
jgi:hypothetical protein